MTPNPYQAPQVAAGVRPAVPKMFLLAALGAFLASAYWAGLTLLIGLGVASGSVGAARVILPIILIGLYAVRGAQLYKGDPAAAAKILWLHAVGGVLAVMQMANASQLLFVLQGLKVAIHLFGAITAYLARRAYVATHA